MSSNTIVDKETLLDYMAKKKLQHQAKQKQHRPDDAKKHYLVAAVVVSCYQFSKHTQDKENFVYIS